MSGASVTVNPEQLAAVRARLEGLCLLKMEAVLDIIGAQVEGQTRRRLNEEEFSPGSGLAWPEWSPDYAKTRHAGHKKLLSSGHLEDSITYVISPGEAEIGTNLIYAATHQYGDESRGIPSREFLGLSRENLDEIEDRVTDYLAGKIEGASA